MGPVAKSVETFIDDLGPLAGADVVLVEAARAVAANIDANEDPKNSPALTRELRLVLKQLIEGHVGGTDDEWSNMATPD